MVSGEYCVRLCKDRLEARMNQTKCVEVKILQFYLHIKAAKYITMKPEEKEEEMYLNFPRNETVTEKKKLRGIYSGKSWNKYWHHFFCASKTAFTQCKRKKEKKNKLSYARYQRTTKPGFSRFKEKIKNNLWDCTLK